MALFAVILVLVTDRQSHPGRLWAVPFIVLAWANIHGSFFLGPAVLGLAWLEDIHDRVPRPHQALVVAIVSVAAACVTPFGPGVWVYALGLSTNGLVSARITEWQPTSLHDLPGLLFFASVLAVITLLARRGTATAWPTLAWLGFFFAIGTYAIRGVAWWPLGAVAPVAGLLVTSRSWERRPIEPLGTPLMRRLNAVVAGILIVAGIALLPAWRPTDPDLDAPQGVVGMAPPGITASLRDLGRPGDRIFNPQAWGSWFEFELPDLAVAVDSRIELFPIEVWDTYNGVIAGVDGWQARLADWDVSFIVVPTKETDFAERLLLAAGVRFTLTTMAPSSPDPAADSCEYQHVEGTFRVRCRRAPGC